MGKETVISTKDSSVTRRTKSSMIASIIQDMIHVPSDDNVARTAGSQIDTYWDRIDIRFRLFFAIF